MMNAKPKVLVFAGSIRRDSLHRSLARIAAGAVHEAGFDTTLADLRDYPMPLYDGDLEASEGLPAPAKAFKELLKGHDALVVASPEYNGSFSALLKNAIDWASRPEAGESPLAAFHGKKAILLSTSPGPVGGARGLRHLRELLEMIAVEVVADPLPLPRASHVFTNDGLSLARPEDANALAQTVERLSASLAVARPAAA
jgi:chromate reductase, NAD(P)H dehydrogenase (quinone)